MRSRKESALNPPKTTVCGAPMRLVPTRANTQPAFGGYVSAPDGDAARAFSLFVLTLREDLISAITWFADTGIFPQFGLPRILR